MFQRAHIPGSWLDGTAVALSALCVLHCIALPLVVAGLPFLAHIVEGHLHAQMLVVVLPLSVVAFGVGYRRHHDRRVIFIGLLGMLLLVFGATIAHDQLGLAADRTMTILGALVLGAAHLSNAYYYRFLGCSS